MQSLRDKQAFICDMDGVIYHGNYLLPGVKEFVDWLGAERQKRYLFLTNSSERSPRELQHEARPPWAGRGPEEHFYTSALATAQFLSAQSPRLLRLCHRRTGPHQRAL